MKAFIAHSFNKKDESLVDSFKKYIESLDLNTISGEPAQNISMSSKVQQRIDDCELFIGIFTIAQKLFCNKKIFNSTSYWVIQESGYAIGKGKELLFLVEKGINDFPKLQGDLEVNFFSRDSLEKDVFQSISQMISSIKKKKQKVVKGTIQATSNKDIEEKSKSEEDIKATTDTKQKPDTRQEIFKAIKKAIKNKDFKKAFEIFENRLQKTLNEKDIPIYKAAFLKLAHSSGDVKAFDRLLELSDEHKDNPLVQSQVALRFKEMREYRNAYNAFIKIIDLYDKNKTNNMNEILNFYLNASECLEMEGNYSEVYNLLYELLNDEYFKDNLAIILKKLAYNLKKNNDLEKYFIFAELALENDISDTDFRFDLAYEYGKMNINKLCILHYKKLTESIDSPISLNNLGVALSELKLKAKSIDAYRESSDKNITLASANIADRYIDQGFLDEATQVINKANELSTKGISVHGNIGIAKNKLESIIEDENSKEASFLIDAEKQRKFRVNFAQSYYVISIIDQKMLEGVWKTNWGELHLTLCTQDNKIKLKGEKKVKDSEAEMAHALNRNKYKEFYKIETTMIEGSITNLSGSIQIKIEEGKKGDNYIDSKKKIYDSTGYIIVNKDFNEITLMEKKANEDFDFFTWEKLKE